MSFRTKNACYSQAKYYLCKQNNKRSLLGRKQQLEVARSFPNHYLFSYASKVTSLFSMSCILRIIFTCRNVCFRTAISNRWLEDAAYWHADCIVDGEFLAADVE